MTLWRFYLFAHIPAVGTRCRAARSTATSTRTPEPGASSCRRRSAGNGASGRKARRRPEAMVLAGGDFASAFFQNTLFARSVWSGGARCPLRTWITSDRIGEMRRSCGMKRTFRPYATPATAGRRPRRMVGLGTLCVKAPKKTINLKLWRNICASVRQRGHVNAADGGRRVES